MAIVKSSEFAHVRLTVADIGRSKAFYDKVFGWPIAVDMSGQADDPQINSSPESFYGGVVYQMPNGSLFGLRPVAPRDQSFDSATTGLDHISFAVESREALEAAKDAFESSGIPHGDVTELSDAGMAILSFSDPDGIHCELTAKL